MPYILSTTIKHLASTFILACFLLLGGCSTIGSLLGVNYSSQQRTVSNAVEYLYPNQRSNVKIETQTPELIVPLNVGVAFVPDSCDSFRRHDLNEELKRELINEVADRFKEREIINKVIAIPSHMMKRKGSFTNLRKIKNELDIDVVVLLSYDQVQYTERNALSLAYHWTIVGKFVFEGDQNDTVTVMDAAVYDIASEELLFRSEGTSNVQGSSASAFVDEELRQRSQQGFKLAIDSLAKKLDWDVYQFRQKIKHNEVDVKVSRRSGGGAISWLSLIFMVTGILTFRKIRTCYDSH